jgi:two-component system cell cycle response regulator DivK
MYAASKADPNHTRRHSHRILLHREDKRMTGYQILIIEDNVLNLDLAIDLLEVSGFVVHSATTAEEGLRLAREFLPDLVLMDLGLPGLDGLTATKLLKANPAARHLKVIGLSAHAMKGDEETALKAGCDSYLTKPIDTRTFAETISRFIASGSLRSASDVCTTHQSWPLAGFHWPLTIIKMVNIYGRLCIPEKPIAEFLRHAEAVELGEQNVTLKTLEHLCDRFKCSISDLFEDWGWIENRAGREYCSLQSLAQLLVAGMVFLDSSVLVTVPSDDWVTVFSFDLTVPSLLTLLVLSLETSRSHPTSSDDNAKPHIITHFTISWFFITAIRSWRVPPVVSG